MGFKRNIVRILLVALWLVLGSSVLVLLVAAINIKNHKSCNGITIKIVGAKQIFFLDKADILKIIAGEGIVSAAGKAITDFNLQRLETILERNVWVKDAELFFDNNLVLHINIIEKEPVARIFTNAGYSFYIDSSGSRMPLNDKMSVRLPVFTGFPTYRKQSTGSDSLLVEQIKRLAMYIRANEFWMAQIAQVEVTPDRNFELVPTVGNHIIQFGDGENYESKFRRLLIFYKQVLSKTGIDKYSRINVQYDKQVIGTKKGAITKIDSVQALKNIQRMIDEAKKISEDSVYDPVEINKTTLSNIDSRLMALKPDSENEINKIAFKGNSNIIRPKAIANGAFKLHVPAKKATVIPTDEIQKPKAVMKKLVNNK